jgi:hypothetical protein
VIDTVLNLLFRCPHHRLTRPVSPVSKAGEPHGAAYVVCLDCGKQFAYDVTQMKIGKPLASSSEGGVLRPDMPGSRNHQKVKYALWAVPLAFVAGALLRRPRDKKPEDPGPPRR